MHVASSCCRTTIGLSLALLVLITSGCAFQTAERVGPDDDTTKGIRYWLAAPYLLVSSPVLVSQTHSIYVLGQGGKLELLGPCPSELQCQAYAERKKAGSEGNGGPKSPNQGPKKKDGGQEQNESQGDIDLAAATGEDSKKSGGGSNTSGNGSSGTPTSPKAATSSADSGTGAISVIWLPDYCHQYAYRSKTFLSKSIVNVTLADGWKLGSVSAETDSTAIASGVLDLVGTYVTATEETARAALDASMALHATPTPPIAGPKYWLLVEAAYLAPGVYPIFESESCTDYPRLIGGNPSDFSYEISRQWKPLDKP